MNLHDYIKVGSDKTEAQKYVRVDTTQAIKKDATFTRKAGQFNSAIGVYSVPEYGFTFRADVPNGDGDPSGQRLSIGTSIRLPVKATADQFDQVLTDFRSFVNDEGFKAAVIAQLFPCEGVCAPEGE